MNDDQKPLSGWQIVALASVFGVVVGLLLVAFGHH